MNTMQNLCQLNPDQLKTWHDVFQKFSNRLFKDTVLIIGFKNLPNDAKSVPLQNLSHGSPLKTFLNSLENLTQSQLDVIEILEFLYNHLKMYKVKNVPFRIQAAVFLEKLDVFTRLNYNFKIDVKTMSIILNECNDFAVKNLILDDQSIFFNMLRSKTFSMLILKIGVLELIKRAAFDFTKSKKTPRVLIVNVNAFNFWINRSIEMIANDPFFNQFKKFLIIKLKNQSQ